MAERLRSGAAGLDEVLNGGLPANAINLILGLPGTGKTLLAQQYVFANATTERPAVYLSTVSEPYEKIVRYGQTLEFFDPDAVGRRVFFEDLGSVLLEAGLSAVLARIRDIVNEREPGLLVIDSIRPFAVLAASSSEHRRFLHELAARLSVRPTASLWLGEYAVGDMATAPEFAVADAVLWLTSGRYEQREIRLLQVLKLRGSGFLSGRHAYRLASDGLRVFPRLADRADVDGYRSPGRRVSSGIESLDSLLGGGYPAGSSTLLVGPSGVGKTVAGLHFAVAGARAGEATAFATFDENPSQIEATAAGFGWSFATRGLRLMYRSAVDLHLDEWVYELLGLIDSAGIRRVFIDGVSNLIAAAHEKVRFQEYIYSLIQRLTQNGITTMMSLESAELFGPTRRLEMPLSQVADNVVLLQFVRRENEYRRALTMIKTRGFEAAARLNEYVITANGIELRQFDGWTRPRA